MLLEETNQLSEEPVFSNDRGRYKVYRGFANGDEFYTVTEGRIPVGDYRTYRAAEQEAIRLEREAKAVRHGQYRRFEEVLA